MTRLETRLVAGWRGAWRWFSLQAMVLAAAIQGAWAALPDEMKQHVPAWLVTAVSMIVLLLGIAGRLVKQGRG